MILKVAKAWRREVPWGRRNLEALDKRNGKTCYYLLSIISVVVLFSPVQNCGTYFGSEGVLDIFLVILCCTYRND